MVLDAFFWKMRQKVAIKPFIGANKDFYGIETRFFGITNAGNERTEHVILIVHFGRPPKFLPVHLATLPVQKTGGRLAETTYVWKLILH